MIRLALLRPWRVPLILETAVAFRARRWYRRPPFLPLPSLAYLHWRMESAYGDPKAAPGLDELVSFLVWARRARAKSRRRQGDAWPTR